MENETINITRQQLVEGLGIRYEKSWYGNEGSKIGGERVCVTLATVLTWRDLLVWGTLVPSILYH